MLTSTARLKQPVGVYGSGLLTVSPSDAGEFGVELAFDVTPKLWKVTSGILGGSIIKHDLLDFEVAPVEDGLRPCSSCGCMFKSVTAFSHCEDHKGLVSVEW